MNTFHDKRISVIGAARSGLAAARILTRLGAHILLSDSQTAQQLGTARVAEIEATGAAFVLGANMETALPAGTELVVTSPGVPKTAPVLQEAVRRGIPVWSEIELAYRLTDAPILATTGTNGKTTTTLLLGAILQAAGKNALVCGNVSADEIKRTLVEAAVEASQPSPLTPLPRCGRGERSGSPFSHSVGEGGRGDEGALLVAEISSFQLEWIERFAPKVAILTNVTPDHLNRHASFDEYAQTKARLFAAQGPEDWAVLNYDNPTARAVGQSNLPGRRGWFTRSASPPDDGPAAWLQDGVLTVRLEPDVPAIAILPARDLPPSLPGAHSVENVLAASIAALAMGVEAETIARAVRNFGGVAHRMERVAEIGGVLYINNSMCTNVAAAIRSLEAMERPTIVIAGGADKGLDFAPLAPTLRARAKHLILLGAAAEKMETTFRAGGYANISRAETLQDAVTQARARAVPGDAVLLAPACASFDMFTDFEARGAAFREAVRALAERSV